jgi:hypothetical protein
MIRRVVSSAVVASSVVFGAVAPAFATQWDGEDRGTPLSTLQVLALFVGIPAAVIGLVYFLAFVPKRKDKSDSAGTDIAIR